MAELQELYRDRWGAIVADSNTRHIEIHWTEATADMTGVDFMAWLERFAGFVEFGSCVTALVDARMFRMNPGSVSTAWRDQQIIPRYDSARVRKFAFVMPAVMLAIGAEPAAEGPAEFPTAYFSEPEAALEWLNVDK